MCAGWYNAPMAAKMQNALLKLKELEPTITLKLETYNGWSNKATFIDIEFGEWEQTPKRIYMERRQHPKRAALTRAETNIKKYGVANVFAADIIKNKIKESCLKNLGVPSPAMNENIKQKIKATNNLRYGGNAPMNSSVIKEKAALSRNQYSLSDGRKLSTVCKEKGIGVTSALRIMHKCGILEVEKFINNFDSSNSITYIEQKVLSIPGTTRWNKKAIDANKLYKPDIKINDTLYIDVDGLYWHSDAVENHTSDKNYHFDKRKAFNAAGVQIMQFREDEIRDKFDIVKSIIAVKMNKSVDRFHARKLTAKTVSSSEAKEFFTDTHLMGWHKSKVIGLYNGHTLVCALSYKIKSGILDIVRFSSKKFTVVNGGLSKLISIVEKYNGVHTVQSWVDLRYGNGDSLLKCNLIPVREVLSWKWTDKYDTYNRLACKANMDHRKLTEKQHAEELKWFKIYDAGQRLFVKKVNNG